MVTMSVLKKPILANLEENILLAMDVSVIKMGTTGLREELMIASMSLVIF